MFIFGLFCGLVVIPFVIDRLGCLGALLVAALVAAGVTALLTWLMVQIAT